MLSRMKFKHILILIGLSILLVGCGANGASDDAALEASLDTVTLQLSWTHQTSYVGFYAAIGQNYYQEEGIEISFVEGGFDENGYINPITGVIDGPAQFGIHAGNSIITAKSDDVDIVVIASGYQTSPRAFISLADKNILTPADWTGQRVAVRSGGDAAISYIALIDSLEINRDRVTEITDSEVDNIEALINDQIDVIPVFAPEEIVELEEMGHEVNAIFAQDYGVAIPLNVIFTTQELVNSNPDLVERFLRATIRGFDFAIRNPTEASELVSQHTEVSAEEALPHIQRTIPLFQPAGRHPGQINPENWILTQDMLLAQGILTEAIDIETIYDLSFQEKVFEDIYGS